MTISRKSYQERTGRRDGGKIEWKLSEVNTRAVSRGQNELLSDFKVVVGRMRLWIVNSFIYDYFIL